MNVGGAPRRAIKENNENEENEAGADSKIYCLNSV